MMLSRVALSLHVQVGARVSGMAACGSILSRGRSFHSGRAVGARRSVGVVGLPNIGKSTLFNALTSTQTAEAANYPFCTIEPNTGIVAVPDRRLDTLAAMCKSQKVVSAQVEFVDIAGLVKGASTGSGLGNKFLGNIREVTMIIHMLRCFENDDILHVEESVDALRDMEIIRTELLLADLESVERQAMALQKKRARTPEGEAALAAIMDVRPLLEAGKMAIGLVHEYERDGDPSRVASIRSLNLLTAKPVMYVCNVDDGDAREGNAMTRAVEEAVAAEGAAGGDASVCVISAELESQVANLESEEEKAEFLAMYDLSETGLAKIVRKSNELLGMQCFYTAGPKEARAWAIPVGCRAQDAAGTIHTDMARGFIRAETIGYDDFVALGGEKECKDAGRMRLEGKDYVVKDGDVMVFRFNV